MSFVYYNPDDDTYLFEPSIQDYNPSIGYRTSVEELYGNHLVYPNVAGNDIEWHDAASSLDVPKIRAFWEKATSESEGELCMRNFQLTNIFASKTVIVSMVEQNSQRTGTHILSGIGSNLEDCLDEHQVDFLSNFSSMMGGLSIGESKLTEHPMGVAVLAEMTLNRRRDALALHKMAQTEGDLERRAILYARMANTSLILHIYKATRETLLYIEEKEMCHPPLNEWEILSLGGLIGNPKRRKDWIQCKTDQDRQQEMLKVIRSCREYWNSKLPDDKRIKVEFKFEVGLTEPINSVEEMYLRRGEVAWTEQAEQADNESTS